MKRVLSLRFADSFRPIWVATVLCCSIFSLIFMANSSSAQKAVTDSRHEQSDFAASGGEESKAGTDGPLVSRREVRVQSTSTNAGQPVIVNIRVDAFGDEAAYGFVVLYDQTILSNPVIGAGNAGSLTRACNSSAAGVVNCSVGTFPNNAPGSSDPNIGEIGAGNNQILITITFNVSPGALAGLTPVTFRQSGLNSPPNVSNDAAQLLTFTSVDGTVTMSAARQVRVESTSSSAGAQVTVNFRVDAVGDEAGYGFVVLYDQTKLSNPVIGAGNAGSGTRACNSGTVGVVNCSVGTFPNNLPGSSDPNIGEIGAGNNQILITITFTVAANALSGVTPVTFRQSGLNSPPNVSNDAAQLLTFTSVDGTVTMSAARQVRVESTSSSAGAQVTVNFRVDAVGDEAGYGFVVLYDQTKLSNPVIGAGNAGSGTRACNSGTVGVVNCSVGTFPNNLPGSSDPNIGEIGAGNNQILITITFTVATTAPAGTTPVTFRLSGLNSPPNVSNDAAQLLTFDSMNGTVTILGPSAASVSVGGRVTSSTGRGLSGARVALTGSDGQTRTALTNPFAFFQFEDVRSGESYIINVNNKQYRFSSRVVIITDDIADLELTAEP